MALLLRFYGTRGADVISGYSITATISDLFFTMNAGMSIATTILVSQALGANKIDQARENGYHLLGFGVILSAKNCFNERAVGKLPSVTPGVCW